MHMMCCITFRNGILWKKFKSAADSQRAQLRAPKSSMEALSLLFRDQQCSLTCAFIDVDVPRSP